jgi:hypothetical protein
MFCNLSELKFTLDSVTGEKNYIYTVLFENESDKKCDAAFLKITKNGEINDAYYTVSPKGYGQKGWEVRRYSYIDEVV